MQPPFLPILTYHSIDPSGSVLSVAPAAFAEQMACIAGLGFRGISLRAALDARALQGRWPPQAAVLTFDDGYANFLGAALPMLQRHGFTATVFLVSGHLGGANDWGPPPPRLGAQAILSPQQARELVKAGIEIGAHTRSHPDLRRLDPQRVEDEIVGCRDDLAAQLSAPVDSFAYPFGLFSAAAAGVARRAFRTACTTVLRRASGEPLHRLPRVDMYYVRTRAALDRLLTGNLDGYLALRRWGRMARKMGRRWKDTFPRIGGEAPAPARIARLYGRSSSGLSRPTRHRHDSAE
jgi:peptidoglycan/xylan/chitin deacetylase (PgdA/CDA1 family)